MNKGCMIAAAVVALFAVVCIGGTVYFGFQFGNPILLALVEQSISEYEKANPDAEIEATNEAWVKALTAPGSGISRPAEIQKLAATGLFLDMFQTPIRLVEGADGSITAISAGKDREFDTPDDQTSEKAKRFVQP